MRLDETLSDAAGVYFEGTLVESRQTPWQLIEVFDTPALGKLMRIDGANMTSERDEFFYHEALIHPAAITHAAPRNVLIIGGGDGGSAEEVLKHPSVERVLLAELDEGVIDIARKYFYAVHHDVFANPRLDVRIGDGAALVRTTTDRFDLIYLDLTDPAGSAETLYSRSFQADLKTTLVPGGALVMHIGSPFSHPDRVSGSLADLRSVFSRVVPYFVHIPIYGATWGFAVASDTLDPGTIDIADIELRLKERRIEARQFYSAEMHAAMLALPEYIRTLIG